MDVGDRRRALLPSGGAVIAAPQMGSCPALSCPLPPCASGAPSVLGTWPLLPDFLPESKGDWICQGFGSWGMTGGAARVGALGGRSTPALVMGGSGSSEPRGSLPCALAVLS